MENFYTKLSTSKTVAVLAVVSVLWAGVATAKQPSKLGSAETVIGGELVLIDETCTFHGLGVGYALYLTNPRGTAVGKGCAMGNALPPELGMIMVQWGASPVHGAESYPIDDFTWTTRGRAVMAPVLKARYAAKVRMKAKEDAVVKEKAAEVVMVASYNDPKASKTYLGVAKTETYPPTVLITPKPCSLGVNVPGPSERQLVQEWHDNGRTTLGISSDGDKVVKKGCALPNSGGGITVMWDYENNEPKRYAVNWEPKGQEWFDVESAKGN